jgi:hypothetical protein
VAQFVRRKTLNGEIRYDVRTRIKGRVLTRKFARKHDAEAWASRVRADRSHGLTIDPRAGKINFKEFAEGWISRRPELAAQTREDYRRLFDVH